LMKSWRYRNQWFIWNYSLRTGTFKCVWI